MNVRGILHKFRNEFEDQVQGEGYRMRVRIGMTVSEFEFVSVIAALQARACLAGIMGHVDDSFLEFHVRLWTVPDRKSLPFGVDAGEGLLRAESKDQWAMAPVGGTWCMAFDEKSKTMYYVCVGAKILPYWAIGAVAAQIAKYVPFVPVHGAVVGRGRDGVLVMAEGGRGKSSLAASCICEGMDYLSDDYICIADSIDGKVQASPLYRTIKVHPDIRESTGLNRYLSDHRVLSEVVYHDDRTGKELVSLPMEMISPMTVRAVVFLKPGFLKDGVSVCRIKGPTAQRIIGVLRQGSVVCDVDMARRAMMQLAKLSAFEMQPADMNFKANVMAVQSILAEACH